MDLPGYTYGGASPALDADDLETLSVSTEDPETIESEYVSHTKKTDVSEVWFAGYHCGRLRIYAV